MARQIEEIHEQNFPDIDKNEFKAQLKVIHEVDPKNQATCHWVIEVSTQLRTGGRLYMGWSSCKVIDLLL